MCAFAKLDLRENIAKQVEYLNVLKEGVLSEYNHGAELKLSRHLPICATSRVSPTLLSSSNRFSTALKKELSTVKVHYSLIMILIVIMIIICIS